MIDLNFRMSCTGNVLDVANDRHDRYTDLENGAFQETPHALTGLMIGHAGGPGLMMWFKKTGR